MKKEKLKTCRIYKMEINLPESDCQYGYPDYQLKEILGSKLKEFNKFMEGQTISICDGRKYDYDTEKYKSTNCGPHGIVVYKHNVRSFLEGRRLPLGGIDESREASSHAGIVAPCSESYPKTSRSVPQDDDSDPEEPGEGGDDRSGEGR